MFWLVNNKILNEKRITTIEVDRDTPSEINYLFNDGGITKEKFKTKEEALRKMKLVGGCKIFLHTTDNRLVNINYIKDVEQDRINPKRIDYILYNGAPVKELLTSEAAVVKKVEEVKTQLESIKHNHGDGTGSEGDYEPDGGLLQVEDRAHFPSTGETNILYLAVDTEQIYYWDGTDYINLSSGGGVLEKDITSNVTVGGANAGTLFNKGLNLTDFAEKILLKEITPTINTTFTNSGIKEIGTTINSSVVTLKITNESSVSVPINEVRFYNGTTLLKTLSYVKGKSEYVYNYNQNITTDTTLRAELVYNTNSKISGEGKFTFVYASYYGVTDLSTITDTDANTLATIFNKSIKNDKALTWDNITLDDERFCYMYPKSFGVLTSIKDGNGFSQMDGYTRLEVNLTSPVSGKTIPYYVYLLTDSATGMNFKQIYV